MEINRNDLNWNYGATFLKIASSVILLPLILRKMPSEMVGIWTVFMTITTFSTLLDFGFNSSFARNITYIFCGVNNLSVNGHESLEDEKSQKVDYGLLAGAIDAMRWFYLRIAVILFLLLSTVGTYYVYFILKKYKGEVSDIYIAWIILCLINTYNIFTLYYDSLLQGKGLVKQSKQILIIGNMVYLITASLLILMDYGLIAVISAQVTSVVIIRWLSYKSFFTKEMSEKITESKPRPKDEVFRAIYPNAMKMGLTSLGGFLVQKAALIIGSLYLTLNEIAAYGISMQLIGVIFSLAGIYTATFIPKIVKLRVENNLREIKKLYLNGQLLLFITFMIGGLVLVIFGEWGIKLIGSQTILMNKSLMSFAVLIAFLECNHSVAGSIILTKNSVPFFKVSILSGLLTVVLLLFFFNFTTVGLLAMILSPGIAQGLYQNWKWPIVVCKELKVEKNDIAKTFIFFLNFKTK